MSTNGKVKRDLNQLVEDIKAAAGAAAVPYNEEVIWRNIRAYEEYFSTCAVAMRTTSKPDGKRDLSVRYMLPLVRHNPYEIAVKNGLYTPVGHPIEDVLAECTERFPVSGSGIDFSVNHGFEKIWPYFMPAVHVDDICTMTTMPAAIKAHAAHYQRFDLKWVSLLALDFWNKTTNIYLMIPDASLYSTKRLGAMIADLGFKVPSQQELELNTKTVCVYLTFRWDSSLVERQCFVMACPEEQFPLHLHPVLANFVQNVPIRGAVRQYTYNTTYARTGDYYKVEADYTGTFAQDGVGPAIMAVPRD